ncbi:MAG TPA: menaquinone biosynthesis protein [Bacteroidia bacterium]|nr:menaquinone biosynthesis protein [Bacteroidia bacterium]
MVSYFNTLPFRYGLKNSQLIDQIDLQEDIPSICAQKLKFKQVEIGLVPVALLPELENFKVITDYCIGANGKVDSVKLYSMVPLNEIKTVILDYQSKSSVTLTKVLNKFYWKTNFQFEDAIPGYEQFVSGNTAAVVIGDRTFALNGNYKFEYDLAEEWKNFTGLPFVFAAWVSTGETNPVFIMEFNEVLKSGVNNIDNALKNSSHHFSEKFNAEDYLKNKIDFNLDDRKKIALEMFLNYIRQL